MGGWRLFHNLGANIDKEASEIHFLKAANRCEECQVAVVIGINGHI